MKFSSVDFKGPEIFLWILRGLKLRYANIRGLKIWVPEIRGTKTGLRGMKNSSRNLRGTKISGQSCKGSEKFWPKHKNDSDPVSGLENDQLLKQD